MLYNITLSQLKNENATYAPIFAPLLWSSVALGFEPSEFSDKALQLSLKSLDQIPFASKVLIA